MDDNAVETVIYKQQEASKRPARSSVDTSLFFLVQATRSSEKGPMESKLKISFG
jgi:hypothetical protein